MKTTLARASALASVMLALSCGGGQNNPKTAEDGAGGAGPGTGQDGPAPDLSPVAAPKELFAVGRWKNPGASVDTLGAWAKLPLDWRKLLSERQPGIDQVVHFDAPVDLAVSLDPAGSGDFPQPFAVVSVGLRSLQGTLDFARKHGEPVRQIRAGVYRVGRGGSPACSVAAAVGPAPARLVCGDRVDDVDALLPYVTRGLPNESLGSADIHLELRAEPIRRKYSRELRQMKTLATPFVLRELSLDDPRFDRALADAVHALADEVIALTEDADRVVIDVSLAPNSDKADLVGTIQFRGNKSWTVGTFLDAGARSAAAPKMFWKLPRDSEIASFGVTASPKRYEDIRRTLAELTDGFLTHEKIPRRVRDQLSELVEKAWVTNAASVYAKGELAGGAMPKSEGARDRERVRRALGWHIVGIADSPKKLMGDLDKFVKAYNDPQLKRTFTTRFKVKNNEIPTLRRRATRGLPGAITYEFTLPGMFFKTWNMNAKKPTPGKPLPHRVGGSSGWGQRLVRIQRGRGVDREEARRHQGGSEEHAGGTVRTFGVEG